MLLPLLWRLEIQSFLPRLCCKKKEKDKFRRRLNKTYVPATNNNNIIGFVLYMELGHIGENDWYGLYGFQFWPQPSTRSPTTINYLGECLSIPGLLVVFFSLI